MLKRAYSTPGEDVPRSRDPFLIFFDCDYIFSHGLSTDCADFAILIVVENRWDFAVAADVFLSGKSRYTAYFRNLSWIQNAADGGLSQLVAG